MCLSRKVSWKETQGVKLSRGVTLQARLRACPSRNESGGSDAQAGSRVAVILSQYEIKMYLCAIRPLGCLLEKCPVTYVGALQLCRLWLSKPSVKTRKNEKGGVWRTSLGTCTNRKTVTTHSCESDMNNRFLSTFSALCYQSIPS